MKSKLVAGREVPLGGLRAMSVRRTLPARGRASIGPWCFVDYFSAPEPIMAVPPHPHTGLQTISWLMEGQIHHHDSLGNDVVLRPGGVNIMTAGRGIVHSEYGETGERAVDVAAGSDSLLNHKPMTGVQLWTVLPTQWREREPAFDHIAQVETVSIAQASVTIFYGEFSGRQAGGRTPWPATGVEVTLTGTELSIPLNRHFEYGLIFLTPGRWKDKPIEAGDLIYLPAGQTELHTFGAVGQRFLLIGGLPFTDPFAMFWNFVASNDQELRQIWSDWHHDQISGSPHRFSSVPTDPSQPLPAPGMPSVPIRSRRNSVDS